MKLKNNQAEMPYKSPECVTLDMQGQAILCSSDSTQSIDDFTLVEDTWI